jgi:hypothetical protein
MTATIDEALTAVDRLPAVEPCTIGVTCEVIHERKRQTARWGVQHLPDGTGSARAQVFADAMKRVCDRAAEDGELTWALILLEEVAEAMAEPTGSPNLRTELLQIAAVCVAFVEDIDHRESV